MNDRILVAGVGNIFMGDDGFGVHVAQRLASANLPGEARVVDFGVRSFDLAYALVDGFEAIILVDATSRGDAPGTIYTIEVDPGDLNEPESDAQDALLDPHGMNPLKVLRMARYMGAEFRRILVVGCEPEQLGSEEEGYLGLSECVEAAVGEAVSIVQMLVNQLLHVPAATNSKNHIMGGDPI